MAQRARLPEHRTKPVDFPPEADADFDLVREADVAAWRAKLNQRFGIGSGRLVVVDEIEA